MSTDDTTAVLAADEGRDPGPGADDAAVTEAFAQRLFDATLGALDLFAIGLGNRLGLYAALHEHGAATSPELAARTGVAERYAREWLGQKGATRILPVAPDVAQAGRRYALPPASSRP